MATNLKSQTYFILTVALFGFIILVASVSFTSAQTTIPHSRDTNALYRNL